MSGQMLYGRCYLCGTDISYSSKELNVKCKGCGHILEIPKIENGLAHIVDALEKGEQAQKDLEEARREKQEAESRLKETISSLDGIKDGQDVLSRLMQSVMAGQESAEDRLRKLQEIVSRIMKDQGDISEGMLIFSEIKGQLQNIGLDAQAQKDYARDFINWFQDIHSKDVSRLEEIATKTEESLRLQKEKNEQIKLLEKLALQTQEGIKNFHDQWNESQLKKLSRLYHQAENYQCDRAYDKAYKKYEEVISEGGEDSAVLWRMLLCHYCVSYQKDDRSGEWIPIILNPDLTDPDEMSLRRDLLKSMKGKNAGYYRDELAKIDQILDKYRYFKGQVRYDVFISVKQSDADDHYTDDSNKASDLYLYLTKMGYKVFNSRLCKSELVQAGEYEPYIIAALMSARALIVVGTSADNMNSKWVKNEWSRYQWLMKKEKEKTGKTDRRLFCYLAGNMQAYDIPRALNQGQQAIIEGPTVDQQLKSALAFLQPEDKREYGNSAKAVNSFNSQETESLDQVLEQMIIWLMTEDFDLVIKKHERLKVTAPYMKDPYFHLYALCAKKKVEDINELAAFGSDLEREGLFKLALKLCKGTDLENELKVMIKPKSAPENKDNAIDIKASSQLTPEEMYNHGLEAEKKKDYAEAVMWYQKAADQGHANAQNKMGFCYYNGNGVGKNIKQAVHWFQKSAAQGFAKAQYNLALCYELGTGIEKDVDQAFYWFQKAAEQGYADAQNGMGVCYYNGDGVGKDFKQAVYWYQKAAVLRHPTAQYNLAVCYENGEGVEKDLDQAVFWYQKAAEQGHASAQNEMGAYYYNGKGVEKDFKQAVHWFQKAAVQRHSTAQFNLAFCYENGEGVEKDLDQAVYWYQKAADQGNAEAKEKIKKLINDQLSKRNKVENSGPHNEDKGEASQEKSEEMFDHGCEAERKKDYAEAIKWYQKAAEQGNKYAQNNLALCYYNGNGIETDLKQAVYWFQKSADQGFAKSQYNLARCYEDGTGVQKDLKQAVYWYQKAADQGEAGAQNQVGFYYEDGNGVEKDLKQAVYWYQKSADQGHSVAQYNLALCYEFGKGVEKNLDQAVQWYKKAASQGNRLAQCNLAICYEFGTGIEKNLYKAFYWFQKSADQGFAKSQYNLALCYELGNGIEKDLNQAVYWYQKAADQGDADAKEKLKNLTANQVSKDSKTVENGERKEKKTSSQETPESMFYRALEAETNADYTEAVKWYQKAADQGYADAQYRLGLCYKKGYGIRKDVKQAIYWYRKAAKQGNVNAKKALERFELL